MARAERGPARSKAMARVLLSANPCQYRSEVFLLFDERFQTFAVMIRTVGIAEGIVADEFSVFAANRYKMCTEVPFPAPVIKENSDFVFLQKSVKVLASESQRDPEPPAFKIDGRTEEKGSEITVDERELPFKIADQLFRLCMEAHEEQCIIGGDPATAGGGTAAKTVAEFFFGNLALIADKFAHNLVSLHNTGTGEMMTGGEVTSTA